MVISNNYNNISKCLTILIMQKFYFLLSYWQCTCKTVPLVEQYT